MTTRQDADVEGEHYDGSSLETTNGSGDGQVKIETFSGDIEIRKP